MSDIVWFVLIGLATGLLARTLMKGGKFGAVGDASAGVLGAILGALMFRFAIGGSGAFWEATVVAVVGAALLILDLRLIQKSHAERRRPLAFWGRCPPVLKRAPLVPRQPDATIELCRVCGQRHLIERSRA